MSQVKLKARMGSILIFCGSTFIPYDVPVYPGALVHGCFLASDPVSIVEMNRKNSSLRK
jgi:hypothetical protein